MNNDEYILFVQLYVFNLYCIRKNVLSIMRSILVFLLILPSWLLTFSLFFPVNL